MRALSRGSGLRVTAVRMVTPRRPVPWRTIRSARPSPLTSPAQAEARSFRSTGPDHQRTGGPNALPAFLRRTMSCAWPSASPRARTATSGRESAWKSPTISLAPLSGTPSLPSNQVWPPPYPAPSLSVTLDPPGPGPRPGEPHEVVLAIAAHIVRTEAHQLGDRDPCARSRAGRGVRSAQRPDVGDLEALIVEHHGGRVSMPGAHHVMPAGAATAAATISSTRKKPRSRCCRPTCRSSSSTPSSTRSSANASRPPAPSSVKDLGKVMGVIKTRAAGRVDMSTVSARVRSMLTPD